MTFEVTVTMLCLANFGTLKLQSDCPTEKQELGAELVSLLVSEHSLRRGQESSQFIATTVDSTSSSALHFSTYSNTPKTHALLSVARFHLHRPRK